MSPYAQTNIQLYNQMRRAACGEAELRRVHAAYQLAVSLFAGQLRPNQKPFVAHLVGTASILDKHRAAPRVVAAGMLHSAYSHGEFGHGSRGVTARKRRIVQRAVGADCELLIAGYATVPWNAAQIGELLADRAPIADATREVAFLRLADLLEEYLDEGMSYAPRKRLPVDATSLDAARSAVVSLAVALGHAQLAEELQAALEPAERTEAPAFLCGSHRASFVVAPRSHGLKLSVRLVRFCRRWQGKLRRAIRGRPQYVAVAPVRPTPLHRAA